MKTIKKVLNNVSKQDFGSLTTRCSSISAKKREGLSYTLRKACDLTGGDAASQNYGTALFELMWAKYKTKPIKELCCAFVAAAEAATADCACPEDIDLVPDEDLAKFENFIGQRGLKLKIEYTPNPRGGGYNRYTVALRHQGGLDLPVLVHSAQHQPVRAQFDADTYLSAIRGLASGISGKRLVIGTVEMTNRRDLREIQVPRFEGAAT